MKGEPLPQEREVRIDLPVKAFIPVGWVGQEALRLELYRRIATAGDHERLEEIRVEATDRFGRLPPEVETLFAVASLRITCLRLGVEAITIYRDHVRAKPVALSDAQALGLADRVAEGRYHVTTSTLNLSPGRVGLVELPGWVERALLAATGSELPSVSIAG